MDKLNEFFLFIAHNIEGKGYDKNDLAGATIYGITKKYHPVEYNIMEDAIKTNDKVKLNEAIIQTYKKIYSTSYANLLPNYNLGIMHFDFYFNAGTQALYTLQEVLAHLGLYKYKIDGKIYNKTKEAIQQLNSFDEWNVFLLYSHYRREFYLKNKQHRYCCGWLNRVQKIENICLASI